METVDTQLQTSTTNYQPTLQTRRPGRQSPNSTQSYSTATRTAGPHDRLRYGPIHRKTSRIHSFHDFVASQPNTRIWCIQHLTIDGDGSELATAISNKEAIMVSDGSFKDQRGTAALVLQGATSTGKARAVNRVPGEPEDHDSFHSELSGLIGIATLVELLCEYFDIKGGSSVEVACDGLSALNDVFDLQRHVSTKTPHYDLVVATRRIIQRCTQLTW